jgi:hypothetical protein
MKDYHNEMSKSKESMCREVRDEDVEMKRRKEEEEREEDGREERALMLVGERGRKSTDVVILSMIYTYYLPTSPHLADSKSSILLLLPQNTVNSTSYYCNPPYTHNTTFACFLCLLADHLLGFPYSSV